MIAGVDGSFEDRLKNNIASYLQDETTVSSLKMDEIAIEERLSWDKQDIWILLPLCTLPQHRLHRHK